MYAQICSVASCSADENECEVGNPCSHACHNTMGTYHCSCPRGLTISADGRTCQGRTPAHTLASSPSPHVARWFQTIQCPLSLLIDIDECLLEGHGCHSGQDCENTIGSYRCVTRCGRGFRRVADGPSCTGAFAPSLEHLL